MKKFQSLGRSLSGSELKKIRGRNGVAEICNGNGVGEVCTISCLDGSTYAQACCGACNVTNGKINCDGKEYSC